MHWVQVNKDVKSAEWDMRAIKSFFPWLKHWFVYEENKEKKIIMKWFFYWIIYDHVRLILIKNQKYVSVCTAVGCKCRVLICFLWNLLFFNALSKYIAKRNCFRHYVIIWHTPIDKAMGCINNQLFLLF